MALFSYDNKIHKNKNVIFEKWKKFDSLQLWCLLRYKDMFYLFEKVEHVLVSQETPKLQTVTIFSFFKTYIFLFTYDIVIWKQCHLWTLLIFSSTKILTACNFAAPWGTRTCLTFLETSNQYEFGARLTGALQHF